MHRSEPSRRTLAFLFTDIEGSTRRWESDLRAMSPALARHDAILRASIEGHDGVVFKTVGDAFCAAFADLPSALSAAVDAQEALVAEDWSAFGPGFEALRVRMALHVGHAESRDGDWFGPALNRLARLLSTGHGGQILLSLVAAELLRGELPAGAELFDLGEHRLKDLGRPERIFQLTADGLPTDFPPLRALDQVPNNLPQPASSFIGREVELARAHALLERTRLLTLTGMGGSGKTRLALQLAAELADAHRDGSWFVDLAPLDDPSLVPQAVAEVLGVREEPDRILSRTLQAHLSNRETLLLLDNCEHVIEACAELVAAMLEAAPGLRVLATSREPLFVTGETSWLVPPMGDDPGLARRALDGDLVAVGQNEAVRLFIERACAVRPDFSITKANAAPIASICAKLEGIPLAVELAAARVRHLPPEQILARLDDRFQLLAAQSRGVPSRQQTLRGAINWSHDLLTEPERQLFHRLSVFRGGWSLEAAEAVCTGGAIDSRDLIDLLGRLVDQSLVVAEEEGDDERYRLLETLRSYAEERLRESDVPMTWQHRHAEYFLSLAEHLSQRLRRPEQRDVARTLTREGGNIRAALDWSLGEPGDAAMATRFAAALWRYWMDRGSAAEGLARCEAVIQLPTHKVPARERALAHYGAAALVARGDPNPEVFARYLDALALFEEIGDVEGQAWCHNDVGLCHLLGGALDAAEQSYQRSLHLKRLLGEPWDLIIGLTNLAEAKLARGALDQADTLILEAASLAARHPDRVTPMAHSMIQVNAGDIAFERADIDVARLAYSDALRQLEPREHRIIVAELLARLGWTAAAEGLYGRAAQLIGAADRQFELMGCVSTFVCFSRHHAAARRAATRALGEPGWDVAYGEGRALSESSAVALALNATASTEVEGGEA